MTKTDTEKYRKILEARQAELASILRNRDAINRDNLIADLERELCRRQAREIYGVDEDLAIVNVRYEIQPGDESRWRDESIVRVIQ